MSLRNARDRRAAARTVSVLAAAAVVTVGLGPVATAPASADEDTSTHGVEEAPAEETTLLDDPARGSHALRELGSELPVAAERNDLEPTELRSLLLDDRAVWLDVRGRVQYIDPAPKSTVVRKAVADADTLPPPPLAAAMSQTFTLHSKPGSARTIFLDADGAKVGGSQWVADHAIATTQPAWDPAGDGAGFSPDERARLQRVWAIVAEDFAAYDVDVTTEDPGNAAIVKASPSDPQYGARVVISPSQNAFERVCDRGCAGAAYRDGFGVAERQPVLVFPHVLGHDPKLVAEVASHEIGHSLGLAHDGTTGREYHEGGSGWAPIMGVGYYQPITQWSRGEYAGATNREDDLLVMGRHLHRRTDESSPSVPVALSAADGVITSADDVDALRLGSCPAGARVHVSPAVGSPDLDVSAALRDATGTVRATDDPTTAQVDRETATGMDATLRVPAAGKGWQVTIRGAASSGIGYSSYGSLGAYTVSAPGCDGGVAGVPSAAREISVRADLERLRVTVEWAAPSDPGARPITGYVVRVSGASGQSDKKSRLPATARRHTITDLVLGGEYDVLVSALNKRGAGRAAAVNVITARTTDSAPTSLRALRKP